MTNSAVSPSAAAAELLRRRKARRGLEAFTTYTMPGYSVNWHHRLICARLDAFARGAVKRLMIFVPPQHGKSELVSRRLPAYVLGADPDARLIACSYGASLAADMNRDVQRVMDDDPYRRLFPGTPIASKGAPGLRNTEAFEVLGRRGSYRCAGVGGPITGKPMDVGVIDDALKNREEADSPTVRESVWKWYTGAFLSRSHNDTRILITMTRWNEDDLPGRLLALAADDPKADQWEVLRLPAVLEAPTEGDPRQPGEALWPERHSLESLERKKAASIIDWHSMYQQDPRPEGGTEFPSDYFPPDVWFDEWPDPQEIQASAMALDPSKGRDAKHGDYSAYVLARLDRRGTLWVDADLARRPTPRMVDDGIALFQRWRPDAWAIEVNAYQELLGPEFLRAAAALGVRLPLYGVNNTAAKAVRIRSLGPWLAQRRIRFKADSPGARLLVQQLRQFPVGSHDDGPDCADQCIRMIDYLLGNRDAGSQPYLLRA